LLLGWEAHYALSNTILIETVLGFLLGMLIAWLGQRMKLEAFSMNIPIWRIGLRVSLLLFATLLTWPQRTLEQPVLLVYAFGIAVINLVFAKMTLDYFLDK
jgi:hypothetical protein